MTVTRNELLASMAADLSADIQEVLEETGHTVEEVVDRTIPKGSPGSQFHRPFLADALTDLVEVGDPLDALTCLQVCNAMGWTIGVVEVEEGE